MLGYCNKGGNKYFNSETLQKIILYQRAMCILIVNQVCNVLFKKMSYWNITQNTNLINEKILRF